MSVLVSSSLLASIVLSDSLRMECFRQPRISFIAQSSEPEKYQKMVSVEYLLDLVPGFNRSRIDDNQEDISVVWPKYWGDDSNRARCLCVGAAVQLDDVEPPSSRSFQMYPTDGTPFLELALTFTGTP